MIELQLLSSNFVIIIKYLTSLLWLSGGRQMIDKVMKERKCIKDCLKKNFPREWRDRLEREGGHVIPGIGMVVVWQMMLI